MCLAPATKSDCRRSTGPVSSNFHPGENRVERHAWFESRKASTGAEMFTFAERDMFVQRACDIEAIRLLEVFLVAEIDAPS
jgi:hypothetical protein